MTKTIEEKQIQDIVEGVQMLHYSKEEARNKIMALLEQERKRFLEMIPKKLDENWRRTEQEPTKDEQTFIEGFNACIAELRNKIKSLNSSKIIEK